MRHTWADFAIWRFERGSARRYSHMALRYRPCGQPCARCTLRLLTGGFRAEKIRMVETSRAMRATSSWWPTETKTTSSGRRYKIRVRP